MLFLRAEGEASAAGGILPSWPPLAGSPRWMGLPEVPVAGNPSPLIPRVVCPKVVCPRVAWMSAASAAVLAAAACLAVRPRLDRRVKM
jgi:hypothetical protein